MKKVITSNLLPLIISLLVCFPFLLLGKNLSIKSKTNNMRLLLDEGGNLFLNGYIAPNEDPIKTSSKKKLYLQNNGDIKLALSEDSLQIKDELRPNYISGPTQNDFVLYNPSSGSQVWPQAIVGTVDPLIDGDLSIAGVENDNTTPVAGVFYMDGEGVFTRDATSFEFAYANLNGEGRTEYSGGVEQTNLYYITDHLVSTRMTINENCDQVEAYSYTAYGIIKEFAAYSGDATREKFTGKEFDTDGDENGAIGIQLAYFGARFYDPEIGLWTSTDPRKQFFNPYAYSTNPVLHVDKDGKMFTSPFTFVLSLLETLFVRGGLDLTSSKSMREAWRDFDPTADWSKTNKAVKIDMGKFQGSFADVFSRLTWQLPQTILGDAAAQTHNVLGGVKSVTYAEGATLVETYNKETGAFTLGNYIMAERGTDPSTELFMHEWGHTKQSEMLGPLYIFGIGIPSLLSCASKDFEGHNKTYTEAWANYISQKHFGKDKFDWYDKYSSDWLEATIDEVKNISKQIAVGTYDPL